MMLLVVLLNVILCSSYIAKALGAASSICPNGCSSHGVCANSSSGGCACFPSFTGTDCSLRVCPSSRAWVDMPTDSVRAHAEYSECSNMGECDRSSGLCKCRSGFEGAACDILMCPVDTLTSSIPEGTNITAVCSGNGRCVSLREVTNFQTFSTYLGYTHYTGFDADKVRGCVCEEGWGGIACEKRLCPMGDDPLTVGASGNAEEVQLIDCLCTSCQGGLYISFKGQQTPFIPFDASEELIQFYVSQFSSLRRVEVKIVHGTQMCSNVGAVTKIRFILPQGPQPSISIVRAGGLRSTMMPHDISVRSKGQYSLIQHSVYSFEAARNLAECSNRGVCDHSTGLCACYAGFRSSDGFNGNGSIPDCGYRHAHSNAYVQGGVTKYTTCPVNSDNLVCSGNGACDETKGTCTCASGYGASDCSLRTCLSSFAWFGNVDLEHRSADPSGLVECGGVGKCDTDTGKCTSCGGHWGVFYGDRCELFSCPKNAAGVDCSNNGACLSLYEIGLLRYNEQKELDPVVYSQNWDAHIMRGCACSRAISVDGQYDRDYNRLIGNFFFNQTTNRTQLYSDEDVHKFYRGPYAFAATDFKGHACAQAWCPKGDNPKTYGVNEIQQLTCRADNGSFMLSFRENVTLPIDWNSTLVDFKHRLEQIFTIGAVEVTAAGASLDQRFNGHVCTATGTSVVNIEFLTEFGDLPLMRSDLTAIRNIDPHLATLRNGYIMNITEYQRGTKEDQECSGQGMCNESTGRCSCFEGFGSSNGTVGSPGNRGDCTFFNKLYTQAYTKR